jgi:hypothetical protein
VAGENEDELDVVIEADEPEVDEGKKPDDKPEGASDAKPDQAKGDGEDDGKPKPLKRNRSFVDDPDLPEDVRRYIKAQRAKRGDAERRAEELERRLTDLEGRLTETGTAAVTASGEAADARIAHAEAALQKAFEDGNASEMVKAQKDLALAVSAKVEVERTKAQQPKADDGRTDNRQPQQGRYSEESQEWIDANPWFESDPAMRQSAIGFHHHIIRKGFRPDTPEYFTELDRRMHLAYPDFFDDEGEEEAPPAKKPAGKQPGKTAVAPVNRANGAAAGTINLKLTEAEREIARSTGVPELEYGLQRLLIDKKITAGQANQIRKKNGLPEVKV